ncbi:HNH endonuclease [Hyalangium rubrum]|uniref:HNH endonuclease n=1 Tax=Hyalangium rubrum TaxID=3103134 RepID=A0ABU5HAG0_9BACT|nr:HNH endonuclease [Hyalangium sp. s54d21]MDY7230291.1 HNH endonuclease [Hyalangium sp. s54d21]
MRPVERGSWPLDAQGTPRAFAEYAEARGELIARLGEYCSFCESQLNASLAVEHVLPKKPNPRRALDWDNFLLACVNCNSTKGTKPVRRGKHYWPDRDNTARAFTYKADGVVTLAPGLTGPQQKVAKRTLELTGLHKLPTKDPKASDRRWMHRRDAWGRAERARTCLAACDTPDMRQCIIEQATALGYWSIWMTVFSADSDMRQRLIAAFTGTSAGCFDMQTQPVARPSGAL